MSEKPQPFEELDELIERMNRQFGELSRTFDTGVDPVLADISVDVADTDDELVVTADLPGFSEEDIDLRADEESVTLEATAETETVDETPTTTGRNAAISRSAARCRCPKRSTLPRRQRATPTAC